MCKVLTPMAGEWTLWTMDIMDGAPPPEMDWMDTMDIMDRMDGMDTKDGKATGRAGGRAMDNGQSHSKGQPVVATVTAYPGCPWQPARREAVAWVGRASGPTVGKRARRRR